jgi:hypothetical protein
LKEQDELQQRLIQGGQGQISIAGHRATSSRALLEGRTPSRWKRVHDMVGLQQVLPSSHGHLTSETGRDKVLFSTSLSSVTKLMLILDLYTDYDLCFSGRPEAKFLQ